MKGKLIWPIFWALVVVFVVVVSIMVLRVEGLLNIWFIAIGGAVFFLLGVALIVLTVKQKVAGIPKLFLLLTGASSAGIPVSVLLHNAVYGLFILWFGADFWDRTGLGDEPVFFTLAIIICPLGFLVGTVGSIVLAIKNRQASPPSENT